jgi:hypothetical protein
VIVYSQSPLSWSRHSCKKGPRLGGRGGPTAAVQRRWPYSCLRRGDESLSMRDPMVPVLISCLKPVNIA